MAAMKDASFAKGFACGIGYGGVDMVTSTGKTIAGVAKFGGRALMQVGLTFKWAGELATGQSTTRTTRMMMEIDDQQREVIGQGLQVGKFLGTLLLDTAAIFPKIEVGLLTGDMDMIRTALHGSETHRMIFSVASEAITATMNDLRTGKPGQQGYVIGKIVFEVASIILPQTKLGKIAEVTKSRVLARLIGKRNVLPSGAKQVVTGTKTLCEAGCFETGTPTLTSTGNREIETLEKDDVVWASNEFNPAESGWKRVKRTFTHHVSRLNRITIERGDPGNTCETRTETFGVTPEHPLWIMRDDGTEGFIAASDTHVGDHMRSADGVPVIITANSAVEAPPGRFLTVHNFEVEDYHTYHVGAAGVLVHNVQGCPFFRVFDDLLSSVMGSRARAAGKVNPADVWAEMVANKQLCSDELAKIVKRISDGGLQKYESIMDPHWVSLTSGASAHRWKEAFAAMRFEKKFPNRTLSRSGVSEYDFVDDLGDKWDAWGPLPGSSIHPGDVAGQSWFISLEGHVSNPAKGNPFIDLAGLDAGKIKIVEKAARTLQKRYANLGKQIIIVKD